MGVKQCDRRGCENILCDRYSSKYGYICGECFIELLNSDKKIESFMDSKKEDVVETDLESRFKYLDSVFKEH